MPDNAEGLESGVPNFKNSDALGFGQSGLGLRQSGPEDSVQVHNESNQKENTDLLSFPAISLLRSHSVLCLNSNDISLVIQLR